jgi:hypothetical protein
MEGKYIRFEKLPKDSNRKTDIYKVVTKYDTPEILGSIEWFGRWRKYAFFPYQNTVFEPVCLNDIINFINKLMDERKKK